jgi:hypothetical protein
MRILSITGVAAIALLASGFASDASAQGRGHGRGQDKNRARGLVRARQVASENSRLLRTENSRLRRINDDSDSDSDSDKGRRGRKHGKTGKCGNNGDVLGRTGTSLPSGVCVDANGDGICDAGTGADRRRPRTTTRNGGVILGRRNDGGVVLGRRSQGALLAQQVGAALLQRYAYSVRAR